MGDDHIGARERLVKVELRSAIATQDDSWHQDFALAGPGPGTSAERIRQAPAVRLARNHDLVATAQKLPRDATQEMGVAVILSTR